MAKTLIRHAVREDFETLLEIDEASFPGGVAYDADELSYFMTRDGAETIVAEEDNSRSEEHTSELQSLTNLVCRLLLEKKKKKQKKRTLRSMSRKNHNTRQRHRTYSD